MNFKDAVKSIIKPHEEDRLTPLTTVWGENIEPGCLLPEYPRPQMKRESFIPLNGYWDYAITSSGAFPSEFDGTILVPFSPECTLSGVNRQLLPSQFLWYRKTLPPLDLSDTCSTRLILHFGAVDYEAHVYINDICVTSHRGGYLPFHADITPYLKDGENQLAVKVRDVTHLGSQARGKQSLTRGGIFYTAQSGIWQSVWMEQVPASHIENVWFETDYDARRVTAHITAAAGKDSQNLSLCVYPAWNETSNQPISPRSCQHDSKGRPAISATSQASGRDRPKTLYQSVRKDSRPVLNRSCPVHGSGRISLSFTLPEEYFHSWSPQTPFLYPVTITLGKDSVQSYFAMRIFTIERCRPSREGFAVETADAKAGRIPVFCLNHKPCFLMGALDQGYWPDGLYTAPADEALIYDITVMKSLGFNMLRKHIKVESARWYYHCDRLGMIVCQDMVNGGSSYHMPVISYLPTLSPFLASHIKDSHYAMLSRKDRKARVQWEKECLETVSYLKFFPSIAIWVPFNEGWGQFDTVRITGRIKDEDPDRLVDSASGWFDQGCGDFISVHNYFRPLTVSVGKWADRAFFLSEYGGFACHIKGHSSVERIFGYKRYETVKQFQRAFRILIKKSLLPLRKQGLSGAVFTQLSDVEEEVNGILTYDRKINKLDFPQK